MKALVCELCGGNEFVKQDGMFVCQHCNTKYTTEEAKKLMVEGTVKIDKSDETEKALLLARRAQEEGYVQNAVKYYGIVLQNDPYNWEANFFRGYCQAMFCELNDLSQSVTSFANCIGSTLQLIKELTDKSEQEKALDVVISYAQKLVEKNSTDYWHVKAVLPVYPALEQGLKKFFSDDSYRIVVVQKAENQFLLSNKDNILDYDKKYAAITKKLTEEIQSVETNYTPNTKKSGCYIATSVYGSYDCPQVWTLRRYRDYTLAKTWYGRAFIRYYYAVSPTLVKWFGNTDWFRNMWKPKLDKMVSNLNSEGVENTPYEDK